MSWVGLSSERFADLLASPSESNGLEFKEAKNGFDTTKLCKYVVAIANERGGYIILGVTDKRPREVVGSAAFRSLADVQSIVRAKTGLSVEVAEQNFASKRVVVFKVPSRPPGTAYEFKGQYLMRSG